jgi:glycerol-3-phosphate dehydrogenase (NAD(P)+)
MSRIAILGGGSWGTALAILLSRAHQKHEISLWVRDSALADHLRRDRENRAYLPGHKIPPGVRLTSVIGEALDSAEILLGAIPTAHARAIYSAASPHLNPPTTVVSASKGLEPHTHQRMSQVLAHVLPRHSLAVLSGPSFAAEVAQGQPTALVLASANLSLASDLQQQLAAPNFRVYTNDDVLGVELAGAMKNVIAIAAGVCQGLGLGFNPVAALITRGLAEMSRLAAALGARPETLAGLAGMGDLVLTCTGALSRNRQIGTALGQGKSLQEILSGMKMVAEGVGTTAALLELAAEANVELPITEQVDAILNRGKAPQDAIREIMERPLKRE